MLSRTTCLRILDALTAGCIKSLAGLDDDDVEKGRNNYTNLRLSVRRMKALCLSHSSYSEEILKLIDESEDFHKSRFIDHIKDPTNSIFTCCCLPCGFHANEDVIKCTNAHTGVCSNAVNLFLFSQFWMICLTALKKIINRYLTSRSKLCSVNIKLKHVDRI